MKYIVRKTLHYYPIRYFFRHLFLTDDSQLFFSNYTVYIFLFVLIKNLLLNIRTLKEKTKNVF
jgi:hypothetical protein